MSPATEEDEEAGKLSNRSLSLNESPARSIQADSKLQIKQQQILAADQASKIMTADLVTALGLSAGVSYQTKWFDDSLMQSDSTQQQLLNSLNRLQAALEHSYMEVQNLTQPSRNEETHIESEELKEVLKTFTTRRDVVGFLEGLRKITAEAKMPCSKQFTIAVHNLLDACGSSIRHRDMRNFSILTPAPPSTTAEHSEMVASEAKKMLQVALKQRAKNEKLSHKMLRSTTMLSLDFSRDETIHSYWCRETGPSTCDGSEPT